MPTPRKRSSYPPLLWRILSEAQKGISYEINFAERRPAERFRKRLYSYRDWLKINHPDMYKKVAKINISIELEPIANSLNAFHKVIIQCPPKESLSRQTALRIAFRR